MVAAEEEYLVRPPRWAKKKSTWHQRAAAVSLIHSTRQHKNFEHIRYITELLLASYDDMVQKDWAGFCVKPPKPIPNKLSPT
jgi:3-methyladenine DNA glycosylase AlkD